MRSRFRRLLRTLPALLLGGLAACGGGSNDPNAGAPPGVVDTTAPFTSVSPGAGLYPTNQFVTLSANEPATVYYTTDGNLPTVGGVTTISGTSPVSGILINSPTNLRYFSVDTTGNEESPKSAMYNFDFNPPNLFLTDFLVGTYGFLEVLEIGFSSDENVNYLVEVGGDGTPGTGTQIATGFLPLTQVATVDLPVWQLEIGQQNPGNSVWTHVADSAGSVTSFEFLIKTMDEATIPIGGQGADIELTPDGNFGYLLRPDISQVWKFDTNPASVDYNTVIDMIDVVANPTSMGMVDDGSRLYITGDIAFSELTVATDTVALIPMSSGLTPSGIAMHSGNQVGIVGTDAGTYWQLDVDPGSANYRVPNLLPMPSTLLPSANITLSPDENRGIASWTSATNYRLQIIDTAPGPTFGMLLSEPSGTAPALLPAAVGSGVANQAGTIAWATNADGRIGRIDLSASEPGFVSASSSLGVRGTTFAPDESVLLVTGAPLNGIRIIDPVTLEVLRFVPSGGATNAGTGRELRYTPDGKRAYLIRDQGTANAELWMIQLTSQ